MTSQGIESDRRIRIGFFSWSRSTLCCSSQKPRWLMDALKSDQINLPSILLNAIGVGIFEVPEVDSAISRHCKEDE
jgi:hypothetical protein